MRDMKGFTLIELMIVVAILGILTAIALPAYRTFTVNSANSACLDEARAYIHVAVANLASQQAATAFQPGACSAISAVPTFADYSAGAPIDFTPKSPGNKNTRCNAGSAACVIL